MSASLRAPIVRLPADMLAELESEPSSLGMAERTVKGGIEDLPGTLVATLELEAGGAKSAALEPRTDSLRGRLREKIGAWRFDGWGGSVAVPLWFC